MARLRYNGLTAELGGSGLTDSATSVTFAAGLTHSNGTNVPTITGSDYIPLAILDATGHLSEIVWLTAYTAAATTGTISRGQEGTSGVDHSSGDGVTCAALVADVAYAGAKVYRSAAYSLVNGAVTAVPWDAEEWDTDSFHDNSTNPSRLTVPAGLGGKYVVLASVGSDVSFTTGRFIIGLQKNGATIRGGNAEYSFASAGAYPMVSLATEVDLAPGDYMEATYYQSSGAARSFYGAQCAFSMHRAG